MSLFVYLLLNTIISIQSANCGQGDLIIPFSSDSIPVSEYENCIEYTGPLIIPENIITIESRAFYGCTGLSGELIIPDNVKEIHTEAFYGCTGFTSLKLGKKLYAIRRHAFEKCTGMTGQLTIKENIKMIDSYAFSQTNFKEVIFEYAFIGCGVNVFPPQVHGIPPKKIDSDLPINQICGVKIEISKKGKSKVWIWIVIVVVVIVLISLFFILKKYYCCDCDCIHDHILNCCCCRSKYSEAEDIEMIPMKTYNKNNTNKDTISIDDDDDNDDDDDDESEYSEPNEEIEKIIYFKYDYNKKNYDGYNTYSSEEEEEEDHIRNFDSEDNETILVEDIQTFGNDIEDEEIIPFAPIVLEEERVIKLENGKRMIELGRMEVFHATTLEAAKNIEKEHSLRMGKSGMFGAGIYFAANKKIARAKCIAARHKVGAYVLCEVDFGNALILEKPWNTLNLEEIKKYGCNSVMGRSKPGKNWEFVVYERSRTKPKQLIELTEK